MSAPRSKDICIVAGVGNATGTGAAVARAFAAQLGFRVALVARKAEFLARVEKQILEAGGEAKAFPVAAYNHQNIAEVFAGVRKLWPDGRLRVAVWNASQWSRIPFLDITEADLLRSANVNMISAFAFSQEAVRMFTTPSSDPSVKPGGTLLLTGATSATRGAEFFGAFAAGKHALRAMSQSIAREYGKQDVHVCFIIVDGMIVTDRTKQVFGEERGQEFMTDPARTLSPSSAAKAYVWIHQQDVSAWTLELDIRPAHEKF